MWLRKQSALVVRESHWSPLSLYGHEVSRAQSEEQKLVNAALQKIWANKPFELIQNLVQSINIRL